MKKMDNLSCVVVLLVLLSVHMISTEFTSKGSHGHVESQNHHKATLESVSRKLLLSMGLEKPPNIQNVSRCRNVKIMGFLCKVLKIKE
jgi:hypothetical protein